MLPDNVSAPTPIILQSITKFRLFFNITHFCVHYTLITQINLNYIILYIGLEEVVKYVWTYNISIMPIFPLTLSEASADSCAEDGCRRQSPTTALYS
jgi:hypothetical protein